MNSYYTIKESHPPTASQIQENKNKKKGFPSAVSLPLNPTQNQHQHMNPGGPDQRQIIKP